MTVPQYFMLLAAVCVFVRALFGVASLTDRFPQTGADASPADGNSYVGAGLPIDRDER